MENTENQPSVPIYGEEVLINVGAYKDQWGIIRALQRSGTAVVEVTTAGVDDSVVLERNEYRTKVDIAAANRALEAA